MKRGKNAKRAAATAEEDLIRFGISIPEGLLKKFDELLTNRNNQNRSEAIRDLIRDRLVQEQWNAGRGEQAATVTLVYETQNAEFLKRLIEQRRSIGTALLSCLQTPLGPSQCLEVLILRGPASVIRTHAEHLLGLKGILHGKWVMTTPDVG